MQPVLNTTDVKIRAVAHPFAVEAADYSLPEGMTIAEMIAAIQPDAFLRQNGHVFVGDDYIPVHFWGAVRPKAAARVTIRIVPGKSKGGKNPLRTVLSIAVLAAGAAFGGALGAALVGKGGLVIGSTTISAATIGSAVIGAVGNLMVNAIAPPARSKSEGLSPRSDGISESPTMFIEGARNQLRPFAPIPVIFGRHKRVPDLGAKTYTETVDNNQYVRQLFVWGMAPLQVSDIKIGETPIENFEEVEIRHYLDGELPERMSLFPNRVEQEDMSVLVSQAAGWQTRRTDIETDEIIVDITFARGLVGFNDKGSRVNRTVVYKIGISPADANDWTDEEFTLTLAQTAAVRKSHRFEVENGQYDIRISRVTADSSSDQIFDEFYLTALRSITYGPPITAPGVAFSIVRMRASDQLNGAIDQLSGVCEAIMQDWDAATETWVTRVTRNPAAAFRHIAQGSANKRPILDSRLSLTKLQEWHEKNVARGLTYDAVIDYVSSVGAMMDEVAAAGRAKRTAMDGKWSVVIDEAKTVPVQHFTPLNSWDYKGEIAYPDVPHAFRVQFLNEERGWISDERIVYADGYTKETATKFERLEVPGITHTDKAYLHGRENLAVIESRPEVHSFSCDIEHLVCSKGDLIRFTHDVPLVGLGVARVREVLPLPGDPTKAGYVVVDNDLTMQTNKTYCMRFRRANGVSVVKTLKTVVGTGRTFEFKTPFDLVDAPGIDDLVMFGEEGKESLALIIKSIDAGPNYTAHIRAVDAAPEIFNAASGPIPPWESNISIPPSLQRPVAPLVLSIQTDEEVVVRNVDGTYATRAVITLQNNNAAPVRPIVKIRLSGGSAYDAIAPDSATADRIVLSGLDDNTQYDYQIFYRTENPQSSLSANLVSAPISGTFLFIGESGRPDDVQNFKLQVLGEVGILTWDPVENIDFSHYEVRFSPSISAGVAWNAAQPLLSNIRENRLPIPAQLGTYLIKAFDRTGNDSLTAAVFVTAASELAALNVVEYVVESPDFAGVKENCIVDTGVLQLDDPSLMEGLYTFDGMPDMGEVYTSRLSAIIDAAGENEANIMASWVTLASVASLSGADPGNWEIKLQISTTQDDPLDDPEWTEWADFITGDYTFRVPKFRVLMRSLDGVTNPNIFTLAVKIDMPDRIEGVDDIVSDVGGTVVVYSPAYKKKPAIAVTPKNLETGDRLSVTDESRTGFTVTFYDATDTPVSRAFDWIAKGYGRELL